MRGDLPSWDLRSSAIVEKARERGCEHRVGRGGVHQVEHGRHAESEGSERGGGPAVVAEQGLVVGQGQVLEQGRVERLGEGVWRWQQGGGWVAGQRLESKIDINRIFPIL